MTLPNKTKFDATFALVTTSDGKATQNFRGYMAGLDALVSALASGAAPNLTNAASDIAAAAAGVGVGSIYRNGSVLMVRVT